MPTAFCAHILLRVATASEGILTGADFAIAVADFAIPKVYVPVRSGAATEDGLLGTRVGEGRESAASARHSHRLRSPRLLPAPHLPPPLPPRLLAHISPPRSPRHALRVRLLCCHRRLASPRSLPPLSPLEEERVRVRDRRERDKLTGGTHLFFNK